MCPLTHAQREAILYAERAALCRETAARTRLTHLLQQEACSTEDLDRVLDTVRSSARVVLHFHPDRLASQGRTVAESLLTDGVYRNQFETGLSAGSRTAFAGGSRDRWEQDLFGGAYHRDAVMPHERPKYGVLELIRYPDGPLPRFGSCYFVLRSQVMHRCTFTFGGSEQRAAIDKFGTAMHFLPVMVALLEEIAAGGKTAVPWPPFSAPTLGAPNLTVCDFLKRVDRELASDRAACYSAPPGRVLDSGIEAHVHGKVDLRFDVELLVLDPAFEHTDTANVARHMSAKYGFPLHWHCGYRLSLDHVPADFRGPRMVELSRRISRAGTIDAAVIGAAEATLHANPEQWHDWGTRDEVLQQLKQLWHVLVHYGQPIKSTAA